MGNTTAKPSVSGDMVTQKAQLLGVAEQTPSLAQREMCWEMLFFLFSFFLKKIIQKHKITSVPRELRRCHLACRYPAAHRLPPALARPPAAAAGCPRPAQAVALGPSPLPLPTKPHCWWGCGGEQRVLPPAVAGDISAVPRLCRRVGGFAVMPIDARAKAVLQTAKSFFFFTQQILGTVRGGEGVKPHRHQPRWASAPSGGPSAPVVARTRSVLAGAAGAIGWRGSPGTLCRLIPPTRHREPGLCRRPGAGTGPACRGKGSSNLPRSNSCQNKTNANPWLNCI